MNPLHLMTQSELALSWDVMVLRATRSRMFLYQYAPAFNAAWLARNLELKVVSK